MKIVGLTLMYGSIMKQPSGRDYIRVVFLGLLGPVVLSSIGPAYYGYSHAPYWRILVWALTCTVGFFWWAGGISAFKVALRCAPQSTPPSAVLSTIQAPAKPAECATCKARRAAADELERYGRVP
jgi:hypothetical protein